MTRRVPKPQLSDKRQPSGNPKTVEVDPHRAAMGQLQLLYPDEEGGYWTMRIGEELDNASTSILEVMRRWHTAGKGGKALMWLSWALGNAAFQTGNVEAAEVLFAVSAALDPEQKSLFEDLHRLSQRALKKAGETCPDDSPEAMGNYLQAFGSFVRIHIRTKADFGRALVKTYEEQESRAKARKPEEEGMRRLVEALNSVGCRAARIVDVLQIGQTRLGILKGFSREELTRRVESVLRRGLGPEQAAVDILKEAGVLYKEAHNIVNAAENMKTRRASKGRKV